MPSYLEPIVDYISFGIGGIGFVLTLLTYLNTRNFKKQLIQNAELSDFRENANSIIQQLEGNISSINEDNLSDQTFKSSLLQFLIDLESRYSFLSRSTQKSMRTLKKQLDTPYTSPDSWRNISNQLIKLKNSLKKERAIHG